MVDVRSPLVRRFWWRAAQVGLSAVLIVWVLSGLDAESVAEARKLSSDRLLLALVLLALSQVWGGIRLWLLLRRQGSALGYGTVLRLTWFGFFTSNFLPGPVGGDVAKGAGKRITAAAAVPVALEELTEFPAGPFDVTALGRNIDTDQSWSARVSGVWPDLDVAEDRRHLVPGIFHEAEMFNPDSVWV